MLRDEEIRSQLKIQSPTNLSFIIVPSFGPTVHGGVLLFQHDFIWVTKGNELEKPLCLIRYLLDLTVNTAGVFYIMNWSTFTSKP
jgi:hypothetical protein